MWLNYYSFRHGDRTNNAPVFILWLICRTSYEALLQMVEVFHIRSMEAFEELEVYSDGAVMGDGDFSCFVRQTMEIDFDEFIEPLVSPIPRNHAHGEGNRSQSIVEVVDRDFLLDAAEESQESIPQQEAALVIEIAYRENVSDWVEAITNYFTVTGVEKTTWSELRQKLNIAPVEILLGLLLGNFALSQNQKELNSFYESEILIKTSLHKSS